MPSLGKILAHHEVMIGYPGRGGTQQINGWGGKGRVVGRDRTRTLLLKRIS